MSHTKPRIIHVSVFGDDTQSGTKEAPLRTLSAAAEAAQPGDTVTVHAGVYREKVDPPRGGTSDTCRIIYQAAPGDRVVVTGAEPVCNWTRLEGDTWTATVPNSLFDEGDNPYDEPLRGHWFVDKGRDHHRGAVYLNGHWLLEAETMEEMMTAHEGEPKWFARVEGESTVLTAQFPGVDPNLELVEINVRRAVFYPSRNHIDYLTVRGFILTQAATPWPPPTTEQVGLIGTNWSRGWIIEDNEISYSACAGLTLGKYHDPLDFPDQPVVEGTAGVDTYHHTINRALEQGWDLEQIGHHVVQRNHVHHCEQSGICGSLGPVCCQISENVIHDIHLRCLFTGAEQAGIKFHGAIDTVISRNRIFRCNRGIWLDWMSQGTRVCQNLFYQNELDHDLFVEVNHGPFLIDHNLFLSSKALDSWSHGGAYAHNLFLGQITGVAEMNRETPWHEAHSTTLAGRRCIEKGDDRWINNLLGHETGLSTYDDATLPVILEDNQTLEGAQVSDIQVDDQQDRVFLVGLDECIQEKHGLPVTTQRLGRTAISDLPFEQPDGSPHTLSMDYFGQPHDVKQPLVGPFAKLPSGRIQVWPILS